MNENTQNDATPRKAGDRMTLNIKGVEYAFRWIPAGSFMMGSPESEYGRERDEVQHKVNISREFWMLESPITQGMWKSVMGSNPSEFTSSDRLPVECVSWRDCQEYVEKLNGFGVCPEGFKFSLPTEAECEYACRAGTTTPFSFGSVLDGEQANFNGKYPYGTEKEGPFLEQTTEVGKYPANAWGLYDMHGNIFEWCLDWYDGAYPSDEVTDPVGLDDSYRVNRGGCWFSGADKLRAAHRDGNDPLDCRSCVGARLVLRTLVSFSSLYPRILSFF